MQFGRGWKERFDAWGLQPQTLRVIEHALEQADEIHFDDIRASADWHTLTQQNADYPRPGQHGARYPRELRYRGSLPSPHGRSHRTGRVTARGTISNRRVGSLATRGSRRITQRLVLRLHHGS